MLNKNEVDFDALGLSHPVLSQSAIPVYMDSIQASDEAPDMYKVSFRQLQQFNPFDAHAGDYVAHSLDNYNHRYNYMLLSEQQLRNIFRLADITTPVDLYLAEAKTSASPFEVLKSKYKLPAFNVKTFVYLLPNGQIKEFAAPHWSSVTPLIPPVSKSVELKLAEMIQEIKDKLDTVFNVSFDAYVNFKTRVDFPTGQYRIAFDNDEDKQAWINQIRDMYLSELSDDKPVATDDTAAPADEADYDTAWDDDEDEDFGDEYDDMTDDNEYPDDEYDEEFPESDEAQPEDEPIKTEHIDEAVPEPDEAQPEDVTVKTDHIESDAMLNLSDDSVNNHVVSMSSDDTLPSHSFAPTSVEAEPTDSDMDLSIDDTKPHHTATKTSDSSTPVKDELNLSDDSDLENYEYVDPFNASKSDTPVTSDSQSEKSVAPSGLKASDAPVVETSNVNSNSSSASVELDLSDNNKPTFNESVDDALTSDKPKSDKPKHDDLF